MSKESARDGQITLPELAQNEPLKFSALDLLAGDNQGNGGRSVPEWALALRAQAPIPAGSIKLVAPQTEQPPAESASCPDSPAYRTIVGTAIRNFFEHDRLSESEINALEKKYNCQIKSESDAVKYADEAILAFGDPYTDVIPKEEVKIWEAMREGKIIGIGIHYDVPEGKDFRRDVVPAVISSVVRGGPADAAGLRKGDVVVGVDGESVENKTIQEIVGLIRGDEGTQVNVEILRDGQRETIPITRASIDVPAVQTKMIDGMLHLSVASFIQDDTADEMKAAIEAHPEARGYIIDLRDNPGGSVEQALKAASLFMSQGKLLEVKERADSGGEVSFDRVTYTLTGENINVRRAYDSMPGLEKFGAHAIDRLPDIVDKPVVLLVNKESASAAELFAGALRDNNEATLVGETTYGKGIGQTTYDDMPDGSWLNVTNFHYYTPNGTWVGDAANRRYGLKPDIESKMNPAIPYLSQRDTQLAAALNHLRMVLGPSKTPQQ